MSLKNYSLKAVVLLSALVCSFCLYARNVSNQKGLHLTNGKLHEVLDSISRWPDDNTDYSSNDWSHLICAARYMQNCDVESVESSLIRFKEECPLADGAIITISTNINLNDRSNFTNLFPSSKAIFDHHQDAAKLFLLLRVVFDLPECTSAERYKNFNRWVYDSFLLPKGAKSLDENSDHSYNLAWPIGWHNGRPFLLCHEPALQGCGVFYDYCSEYKWFLQNYKYRNLQMNSTSQP